MTGSVNQRGQVQAIGGVNEKVEGFFDVCQAKGPEQGQGVLIPESNVKHLMLRQDVLDAAEEGRFRVFSLEHIDQALELLTGLPAGEADEHGEYPENTVNGRVQARLDELTELALSYAAAKKGESDDDAEH